MNAFTPNFDTRLSGELSGTRTSADDRRHAVAGAMSGPIAAQRVPAAEQRLLGLRQRPVRSLELSAQRDDVRGPMPT